MKIDKPPNSPLHISLDFDKVRLDYLIALQHLDDLFLKPETREYTNNSTYRYVCKWLSGVFYKLQQILMDLRLRNTMLKFHYLIKCFLFSMFYRLSYTRSAYYKSTQITKPFLTFSLISNALLHRGSASLYFPLFPYRTAKLFSVAATYKTGICYLLEHITQQTKAYNSECPMSLENFNTVHLLSNPDY